MIEPENMNRYRRELAAMMRAAADDPASFAQVVTQLDYARSLLPDAVRRLRFAGYSDSDIGFELGVTRQAVRQRWPH